MGSLHRFLIGLFLLPCFCLAADQPPAPWLPATAQKLPRWRGFNLLEKFNAGRRQPFLEEDFRLISKLGFNFVRLPMDYRLWIKNNDWEQFDEAVLKEIDQAVQWGQQYRIHVCLNFHRAPGYTVAKPAEKTSLWTDPETQRVCALHWATFARRYKGIPNERLSFNLMNEPADIDPKAFSAVVRMLVAAIRKEDPDRLVISDGLKWGNKPVLDLADLHIAQATRGYSPMEISHYKASWVNSESFATPRWPSPLPTVGTLLGAAKPESSHPIVINGPFTKDTDLRLRVHQVSGSATLLVAADDKTILEKPFKCGPGEGEWKKVNFVEKYKIYQNYYDRDYTARIPAGAKQVTLRVTAGDWLSLAEIGLKQTGGAEAVMPTEGKYGEKPTPFRYAPEDPAGPLVTPSQNRQWLWKQNIEPWQKAEAADIGVMVGEWGAFNRTPHDIFLRWAEDNLANWKQAGWGWAMWNFRGSFGLLDSDRADVKYEDFDGHKLDRKLLDLLQRY